MGHWEGSLIRVIYLPVFIRVTEFCFCGKIGKTWIIASRTFGDDFLFSLPRCPLSHEASGLYTYTYTYYDIYHLFIPIMN